VDQNAAPFFSFPGPDGQEVRLDLKKFGSLANTKKTLEIALTGVSQRAIFQTPQEAAAREHALHRTDGER